MTPFGGVGQALVGDGVENAAAYAAAAFETAQLWAKFWPQLALREGSGGRAKG